jgi:hypothetical protein
MPIVTIHSDLVRNVQSSLHAYWRIRAANAAMLQFSQFELWRSLPLEFGNLTTTKEIQPPNRAPITDSLLEIENYIRNGRSAADFFLVIISHIESFFSSILIAKNQPPEGTLGNLQHRAEKAYSILPSSHTEIMSEIRERRNCIIHSHGIAGSKYILIASVASLPPPIRSVTDGQALTIDEFYLTYACDGLIAYARQFI